MLAPQIKRLCILTGAFVVTGCAANPSTNSPTTAPLSGRADRVEAREVPVNHRGSSGVDGLLNRGVKVHFRHDALGYAGPVPLDPTTETTGGKTIIVEGIVRSIDREWISIECENGQIRLIPVPMILLVDVKP